MYVFPWAALLFPDICFLKFVSKFVYRILSWIAAALLVLRPQADWCYVPVAHLEQVLVARRAALVDLVSRRQPTAVAPRGGGDSEKTVFFYSPLGPLGRDDIPPVGFPFCTSNSACWHPVVTARHVDIGTSSYQADVIGCSSGLQLRLIYLQVCRPAIASLSEKFTSSGN